MPTCREDSRDDTSRQAETLSKAELKPDTKVTTGGRDPHAHHGFVNTPVYHASTLLYPTADDFLARRGHYTYGRRGTPTSEALETAIQEIEGPACAGVALLPSGLAAISTALLAVLEGRRPPPDDRQLPTARRATSATRCSSGFGVATTYYDPPIGAGIAALMRPNTRAVFTRGAGLADLRDAGHPGDRRPRRTHAARWC